MDLQEVLRKHSVWLAEEPGGERANLRDMDLSGADLSRADLRYAKLRNAGLSGANLYNANFTEADLSLANLTRADLRRANMRRASLRNANLSGANLSRANMDGAELLRANLHRADLSGAIGLLDAAGWLQRHFEKDDLGIIVYKVKGALYPSPESWNWQPGEFLKEVANPDRTEDCGCGVNVATLDWCKRNYPDAPIWTCRICWLDLAAAVVPYNTDGKFRAERVELLELV